MMGRIERRGRTEGGLACEETLGDQGAGRFTGEWGRGAGVKFPAENGVEVGGGGQREDT